MFLTGAGVLDGVLDCLDCLCLNFGWILLSLKTLRTLSMMDDIVGFAAGDDDIYGHC